MAEALSRWQDICRTFAQPCLARDTRRLAELEMVFGRQRLAWAIELYRRDVVLPSFYDFEHWLEGKELPDELVCAAYLIGDSEITALADRLETLRGSWFEDLAVAQEITELEQRLGGLLL